MNKLKSYREYRKVRKMTKREITKLAATALLWLNEFLESTASENISEPNENA